MREVRINSMGRMVFLDNKLKRQHTAEFMKLLVYLAFDIDGCLIPKGGLETGNNKGTVANFLKRNVFAVQIFKYICSILVQDGLKIGLCTGRSSSFAKKIAEKMFIPGTCGYMVAEGGAVKSFFDPTSGQWTDHNPDYLNREDVKKFEDHKAAIIEIGTKQLGGFWEPGKSVITSFNPPPGVDIEKEYRPAFEELLRDLGIIDSLNVENSSSAVDIGPFGVNKANCLIEIVGSAVTTAVLVDANNDEKVTERFLVNLMPKNAQPGIQEIGMQAIYNLVSTFNDLNGTVDMLMRIKELRG